MAKTSLILEAIIEDVYKFSYNGELDNITPDDSVIRLVFLNLSSEKWHDTYYYSGDIYYINDRYVAYKKPIDYYEYQADIMVIDKNSHHIKKRYMSKVYRCGSILIIYEGHKSTIEYRSCGVHLINIDWFDKKMYTIQYKNTAYIPRILLRASSIRTVFGHINSKYGKKYNYDTFKDLCDYSLKRYYAKYLKGYFTIELPVEYESRGWYQYMEYLCWVGVYDDNITELVQDIEKDNRDYDYCSIMHLHSVGIKKYNTYDNTSKYWNICNVSVKMMSYVTKTDIMKYQNEIMGFVLWNMRKKIKELRDPNGLIKFIKPIDITLTVDKILLIKFGYKGDEIAIE